MYFCNLIIANSHYQRPSSGSREAISLECLRHNGRRSVLHAYSYIQQSGCSVKTMNVKNTKKSPIHENVDANITCDFGDGDISRFRSRLPHGHIVTSIIVRFIHNPY